MCGIAGILALKRDSKETLFRVCEQMTETLTHRGPDDSGIFVDDSGLIALGHRRLSILDLSMEGHQPMFSACGRYAMVYNGEVYNYRSIAAQLESRGIAPVFRGHSDTEVMLATISAWGLERAVESFVGMFAFALWDLQEHVLHLVRDRLGIKPLYYGWAKDSLLFASELKALRTHPDFPDNTDPEGLALYLRHNFIPAPFSIFEGIRKLEPGSILTVCPENTGNGCKPELADRKYWDASHVLLDGARNPWTGDEREAVDTLETLLRESVNLRMISDVPLGLFLSGGIDSSTVASLMQSMRSDPIKTFTVGSLETDFDEARYAREVARHLGTDHTELYVTEAETLATVPDIPHIYDEPFGDSSQIPTTLISRLAGQHVTVALSGDGGDELFCGYSRYLFMERLWRTIKAIPRFMRKPAAGILRAISHSLKHRRVDAVSSSLLNHRHHIVANRMAELANVIEETAFVELYRRFMSQIKDPKSFAPGSRDSNQMPTHWSCNLEPMDHFQIMSCLDLASYLPDDILVKVDRAGMSVGLEVRVPILDHRVVEFASRIPSAEKIHGRTGKMQLRSVLRRYVPDRLIDRPKQGFGIPVALWLRGPLREWAEGLLAEKRLANEGYFDVAHVRSIWDQHVKGHRDWSPHIWTILMFQAWLQVRPTRPTAVTSPALVSP
jgi:asparagine synthase (glutamine-hydrolysing)